MPDLPRYPRSGGGRVERPDGEAAPPAIVNAVKLMYAGAALSAIILVISLATAGGLKAAIRKAQPRLTPAQVNSSATLYVSATVIIGLIGAALWLWMAWANKNGKPWARVVSSALFGVATLNTAASFAQPAAALGRILTIAMWLIGLGAIVFLWRPESTAYYRAASGPPS